MRVLVVGGTGFIGPHVVRRLIKLDHEVTLFHRGQTRAELPSTVSHLHGDRARLADVGDTFRRLAPDVVLDIRPLSETDAVAVTTAFRGIARRLVAISSQDVYRAYGRVNLAEPGPPDPVPLTEESPLRDRLFPYRRDPRRDADDPARWLDDYDKILVERVVMNAPDLPGTILRLPMVHGPGDNQHRLFPYLKRMDDNRPAILPTNDGQHGAPSAATSKTSPTRSLSPSSMTARPGGSTTSANRKSCQKPNGSVRSPTSPGGPAKSSPSRRRGCPNRSARTAVSTSTGSST